MTDAELLTMTKLNLQISSTAFDDYLSTLLIPAAQEAITSEGITLDLDTLTDCNLVIMYASYLYRKRIESDMGMPRMLRYAMNNRLFSEKMSEDEDEDSDSTDSDDSDSTDSEDTTS